VRNTDLLFSIIFDVTPQKQAEALARRREGQIKLILGSALILSMLAVLFLVRLMLARHKVQLQLRTALNLKTALFDAIPNPVFYKDLKGRYQEWNKAFEHFMERPGNELEGRRIADLVAPGAASIHEAKDRELYDDSGRVQIYEMNHHMPDGSERAILIHKAAVIGEDRKPTGLVGIYTDLQEQKRREDQLRASLKNNQTLIKEIYHRTKNNMQVISSMVTLKLGNQDDPVLQEQLRDISQRIRTMALVHQQLYDTGDLSSINFRDYLDRLFSSTLEGYARHNGQLHYHIDCPEILLLIDYALPCAMVINELLTNSCKHAFPGGTAGSISLSLVMEGPDQYVMHYADDGIGLDPSAARNVPGNPLGLTMLRMLVEHQLGGTLDFGSAPGMSCTIRFQGNTYHKRVGNEDHAG
jgi:PAS domain S-box-containing protein